MAYLYGDSTPFPFEDNFVETLRALTDMCVALLRIDEQLDEAEAKAQEAKSGANKDQQRLEALAATLVKALEPHVSDSQSQEAAQTAMRILQSAQQILENAKSALATRREGSARDLRNSTAALRASVLSALEQFFVKHEVPDTVWRLHWKGGIAEAATSAQAVGTTGSGLEVALEVDTAGSTAWRRPLRVDTLDKNVVVHLPGEGGWLRRGPRQKETSLDHHFVTEVHVSPERDSLVLRRSDKHASPGLEIIVRAEGQSQPTVRQVAEDGTHVEDIVVIDGVDQTAIERLWGKVEGSILDLVRRRARIVGGAIDGAPADELDRPARLASRLIQSVASIVMEMAKRSPSPRELVLKRDLGNGHRDEVYVARDDLIKRYAMLTPARRALFDAFGLGRASAALDREVQATLETFIEVDDAEEATVQAGRPTEASGSIRSRP